MVLLIRLLFKKKGGYMSKIRIFALGGLNEDGKNYIKVTWKKKYLNFLCKSK